MDEDITMLDLSVIQYIIDIVKEDVNKFTPQELMIRPALLDFCNRYKIEKE